MQDIKDLNELDQAHALQNGPDYEFENQNLSMNTESSNSMGWMAYCFSIMTLSARLPGLVPLFEELMYGQMDGD